MEIPAHGTRVFIIRDKQDRPQLLATNRHITGAFSIKAQEWNESDKTIRGTSETVPFAEYSLYFFVPPGMKVQTVKIDGVKSEYTLESTGLLKISFKGQKAKVNWQIRFSS